MAQDTNKMESYSKIVDAKLRANSVFAAIFNQRHDGAAVAGAVKIPVRTEATAGAYVTATGLAISNPATAGTKAVLPGISLRSVHLCCAPGGQMQCVLQLMDISSSGRIGCSSE